MARTQNQQNSINDKLRNKKRTNEQKIRMKQAQQHTYLITDPQSKNYQIESKDIKSFCITFDLCYGSLMAAKKNKKFYKKWFIEEITKKKK